MSRLHHESPGQEVVEDEIGRPLAAEVHLAFRRVADGVGGPIGQDLDPLVIPQEVHIVIEALLVPLRGCGPDG